MAADKGPSEEKDVSTEDSIRVVCRFRPLNDSEEKAGSKFVIKFPQGSDDQCVSISVRNQSNLNLYKTQNTQLLKFYV